jgi:uncharacterized RmlC-like cupin family protein
LDDRIFEAEVFPGYAFYKEGNVAHQMLNPNDEPLVGVLAKVKLDG